jgi:hypothetical protein
VVSRSQENYCSQSALQARPTESWVFWPVLEYELDCATWLTSDRCRRACRSFRHGLSLEIWDPQRRSLGISATGLRMMHSHTLSWYVVRVLRLESTWPYSSEHANIAPDGMLILHLTAVCSRTSVYNSLIPIERANARAKERSDSRLIVILITRNSIIQVRLVLACHMALPTMLLAQYARQESAARKRPNFGL